MQAWQQRTSHQHSVRVAPAKQPDATNDAWSARVAFDAWQEAALPVGPGAPTTGFARLFEFVFEHAYYNATPDHRCPGFDVYPNVRTVALMRELGLLFRGDGTSFSVLCDVARLGSLGHYLVGDRLEKDGGPEYWTHLSFFLAPNRAQLVNVTDIALDADVLGQNLYFRNDDATLEAPGSTPPGTVGRPRVTADWVSTPVRPARFFVDVPPNGIAELADVSETPFLRVDTDVDPGYVNTSLAAPALGPPVMLDLSKTYEGYNLLTVKDAQHQVLLDRWPFVYTLANPAPLCYLHVLLCRPTAGRPGVYPAALDPGGGAPRITPTHFRLRFAGRSARWAYHVFPSVPLTSFTSLSIAQPGETPGLLFAGWQREVLPNGREAALFVSTEELPLQQRSLVRLELRGTVRGGDERVLVARLPVASADEVPRRDESGNVVTDIYVHL